MRPPQCQSPATALLPRSRGEGAGLGREKAASKDLRLEKMYETLKKKKITAKQFLWV